MQPLSEKTQHFIEEHRTEDVRTLALKASGQQGVDISAALRQIEGWQTACRKLPLWSRTKGIIFPPHLSMEQCSSELTALYKTEVMGRGDTFADLTGGFGVDCSYLSRPFQRAWYIEQNEELCQLAEHNFGILGLSHITVCNAQAEDFLEKMLPVDCLFLDPARRDEHGGKTIAISDCTPDVTALLPLLRKKAKRIMVKLSPMLDIAKALHDLPDISDVHIVAVHNECKELLLVTGAADTITYHTINITHDLTDAQCLSFTNEEEQNATCTYTSDIGNYLYEPNAALLKAGAFRLLAERYHLKKLHPNSHLYTSDTLVENFPGRQFRIEQTMGFSKKETRTLTASVKKANLSVRNFPASVAGLRKRLKLSEGGDTYLFATTLENGNKVLLVCRKADPQPLP